MSQFQKKISLLVLAICFMASSTVQAGGCGQNGAGWLCRAAEGWRQGVLSAAGFANQVTNQWMRNIMNIPIPAGAFEWTTAGNVMGRVMQVPGAARAMQVMGEGGLAVPLPILQAAGRMAGPAFQYGRAATELAAGKTAVVRNAFTGAVQRVAMGEAGAVGNFGDKLAEAATLPDIPAVGRSLTTPARKFIPGETPYLEFDVGEAYLSDDYIRMGSNMTAEARVAISPWGNVVIFEGRHRTVSAAVGKTIPLITEEGVTVGGVPGIPGRLRYEYVGRNISFEDWMDWRERFVPIREIIQNPEKVKAALSGSTPWVEIKPGQPIRLR